MNKFIQLCIISCLMITSALAFAEGMGIAEPEKTVFFVGLGGSFNSVKFKQDYSAVGIANVFDNNGVRVATGQAGGPGAPFSEIQTTFSPEIQAGFYRFFKDTSNFWGIKYLYQYLDVTSDDKGIDTPQAGALTPVGGTALRFTGNVITKSAQTKINHEMSLLAFIGHSIDKSNLYMGIGPSLFGTKSNIYQAFGYANLNGIPNQATGTPLSFSNSKWVWGGAIQIGLSYILDPSWVIDFNYTYAISQNYDNRYSAPFTTMVRHDANNYTDVGTLYISTKRQIRAQALNITINKIFSL